MQNYNNYNIQPPNFKRKFLEKKFLGKLKRVLNTTGWAKKTRPVWALITQRRLLVERRVICQKF